MRIIKYLCVILCIMMAFSLSACEEQDNPSVGEFQSDGVVSTDFDPNAFKPKPAPEKLYMNYLTYLEDLRESELLNMPLAVVINNSAAAKSSQSGINSADIVFEAQFTKEETLLLAVYKAVPDGINIGPVANGIKVFADIAYGFNWKFTSDGLEAEHTESALSGMPYVNLNEEGIINPAEGGTEGDTNGYVSSDALNRILNKYGFLIGADTSPVWFFNASRPATPDSAKKITVKYGESAVTEFNYNEAEGIYTRVTEDEVIDNYSNVFILKSPTVNFKDCEHIDYDLPLSGEGYYATAGGYEKFTWKRKDSASPIYFENENGPLSLNPGRSYICLVSDGAAGVFSVE